MKINKIDIADDSDVIVVCDSNQKGNYRKYSLFSYLVMNVNESCREYEVSVVVASYNPQIEKLLFTIKSIVNQKNVDIQIVITDDGSFENYFYEIVNFLNSVGFYNYKFIIHKKMQERLIMFLMR